jgi:hypothetical protein
VSGQWVRISCEESEELLCISLMVAVGQTDVDSGYYYREWETSEGVPVLRDEREDGMPCKHWEWRPEVGA